MNKEKTKNLRFARELLKHFTPDEAAKVVDRLLKKARRKPKSKK
jgi:hypothetical protein